MDTLILSDGDDDDFEEPKDIIDDVRNMAECDAPVAKRHCPEPMVITQPLPHPRSDHAAEFVRYTRPYVPPSSGHAEFMIVDAENVIAKVRLDMDDPTVDHSPLIGTIQEWSRQANSKKRESEPWVIGTVVKLYGVTAEGSSICVDVYGHYPAFRLQIVKGTPSQSCLVRMSNHIERNVIGKTSTKLGARNVVDAKMVEGFSAFPYVPTPSTFYEYRVAKPQFIRTLAEYFVKTPAMSDESSEGGLLGVVPHSAEDSLTQYMVQSGLCGFGWAKIDGCSDSHDDRRSEIEQCTCSINVDCARTAVGPMQQTESIAPLRVMGIDIECIKDEGMPTPDKNPVIIIGTIVCTAVWGVVDPSTMQRVVFAWFPPGSDGIGTLDGVDHIVAVDNETEMFLAFGAFLAAYDPDVYVGHNIVGFDVPYLVTRANALGVQEVMYMGRRRERNWFAPREIIRVRKNGDTRKSLRADTPGRIQLDTLPFIQDQRKESSYSLGALAKKYLGEGKDDVGYQMIKPMWLGTAETRARLCAYCLKDVQLSLGLATSKEFEMILSTIELSRGTRVRASHLLRSGNQEKVKTLVLYAAKTPRFEPRNLPVFFPYEVPKPRSKDEKYQGATVISPQRGARGKDQPIGVGDFSSLYPSIMISRNLDYSTMLAVPHRGAPAPADAPPHHTSPVVGAHFVHREVREGLLPRILRDLLDRRNQAKGMIKSDPDPARKRMYDSRQLNLKRIANSVYGVLSASGGWFVRMEIGESVTSWGRSMIHQARDIARSPPFNANVIYGDTDSIMMVFPGCTTVPDAFKRLEMVCEAVTASFEKPISMAAEKVYEGHIQFGKKRYAGLCHIPPAKPKVDSKGVEKNRLDNCPLVRRMMTRIFEYLLVEQNLQGALEYIKTTLADLIQGKVPFSDLVVTKSISKAEYKSKVVHVEVAKRMKARDPSYMMAPGERIPYVIVNSIMDKVYEKAEDPLWAIRHGMEIDVAHYIKDLSRPISRVLMWFVAPKEMLDTVRVLEGRISSAEDDGKPADSLEKDLKKHLDKMTDVVAAKLFGPGATIGVKRPEVKRTGPLSKFLVKPPAAASGVSQRLEYSKRRLADAKAKCAVCRGRDDDTVVCVQRDCPNNFELALASRDIEDIRRQ